MKLLVRGLGIMFSTIKSQDIWCDNETAFENLLQEMQDKYCPSSLQFYWTPLVYLATEQIVNT